VVVSPENQRLVVSAAAPLRRGAPAPGWGPLPGYCHWRQFRRLDLAVALNLSEANAGELLTLVRQFKVGSCWYDRRGPEGPTYWELWNYLGDLGEIPQPLETGELPAVMDGVAVKSVPLAPGAPSALQIGYAGKRVLLIPPQGNLEDADLAAGLERPEAVVLPAELSAPRERNLIMDRLSPQRVIIYGDPDLFGPARPQWPVPCQFTREGAVSLNLAASEVTASQWRP
jgi:hypothetical protein